MVVQTFDLSTWEVQAGGSLLVQGHPSLFSEFRLARVIMRPCLKKKRNKTKFINSSKLKRTPQKNEKMLFCLIGLVQIQCISNESWPDFVPSLQPRLASNLLSSCLCLWGATTPICKRILIELCNESSVLGILI